MQGKISTLLAFTAPNSANPLGQSGTRFDREFRPNNDSDVTLGVGAGQANRTFAATRALAASAVDNLDLAGGGLLDANGRAIDFARVKQIVIRAAPTNTGAIQIGNATSNAFQGPFSAATGAVNLNPGEVFSISRYDATGWVVTPATGDILRIANLVAAAASYDIVLVGCDA